MTRKLIGSRSGQVARMTALVGIVTLGATACDDPEYAAYCVRKADEMRVEDSTCRMPVGEEDRSSPYGWYYQQIPDGNDTTIVSVISVGQPARGGTYSRPLRSDVLRPGIPSRPVTQAGPSTITRGGLGISSVGSSGS